MHSAWLDGWDPVHTDRKPAWANPTAIPPAVPCGYYVFWMWHSHEGWCVRPRRHSPPDLHFDGKYWWDDDRRPVDETRLVPDLMAEADEYREKGDDGDH